jgi:chromosome segregation ATPase
VLLVSLSEGAVAAVGVLGRGSAASSSSTTSSSSAQSISPSLKTFLASAPSSARSVATAVQRAVELFYARAEEQRQLQQLRSDHDTVKTKLTALNGELNVMEPHRQKLEQEVATLERQRQEQFESLRQELDQRLKDDLLAAGQQMMQELEQDGVRQLQAFEARQRELLGGHLQQELDLQTRELEQLSQEIEVQTQELVDRLSRLQANPSLAESMKRSMKDALAKKSAELETRRKRLQTERDQLLSQRRAEFIATLKQQQTAEHQRRMTIREAGLRQAMAEVLHKSRSQEDGQIARVREALEEVREQHLKRTQDREGLASRLQAVEREITTHINRLDTVEADRQEALARIELALQKPAPGPSAELLSWLSDVVRYVPPELATELGQLQQRTMAKVEQERALQEKARVLRERQLALQLSHEMEQRLHETRLKQQREQEAKAREVDGLLAKAKDLLRRRAFDEALLVVAKAQALNPPQMGRVEAMREDIIAARDSARRQAAAAELERMFARAMQAFQQERYDEAITLFEQVIEQEAAMGHGAPRAKPVVP